jgi:branched-chain amino acid transport system substrate-binding protein
MIFGARNVYRFLGAATAAALFLNGPCAARAADPVTVTAVLSATGSEAFLGAAEAKTLDLIATIVNKNGGIDGRQLKFNTLDDQSRPQNAVELATRAIADGAQIIIGSSSVGTSNAMAALCKNGPVLYALTPGVHPEPGSYVFSAGISTADTLNSAVKYLSERGLKKVAVITSTDATGQDADRAIDATFATDRSMSVVDHDHFNTTDVNVTAQLTHVKASGAQALIAWSSGAPLGTILRGAHDAGLDIPVMTTAGNLTYAQMEAYASFMPSQLLFPASPAFALDQLPPGPVKSAVQTYTNALASAGIRPENGSYLAWDATMLVLDALKKLGPNATAAQLRTQLADVRGWPGIAGRHDFRAVPQRGVDASAVVMVRWDPAAKTWVGAPRSRVADR